MKAQKVNELRKLATAGDKRKYVHDLSTGKYFIDDMEVSEAEFRQSAPHKEVMIDLGEGTKPDDHE